MVVHGIYRHVFFAAKNGHLEVLKYAHENGCPWNVKICSYASLNGHLEVLKYAHDNDCPWDNETCSNAAYNGQLEVLKYAYENDCPWDNETCSNTIVNGHSDILKWLIDGGNCKCCGKHHKEKQGFQYFLSNIVNKITYYFYKNGRRNS